MQGCTSLTEIDKKANNAILERENDVRKEPRFMHIITNAAFCANYDNYDFLLDVAHSVTAARTGIELSIYSDKPDFIEVDVIKR